MGISQPLWRQNLGKYSPPRPTLSFIVNQWFNKEFDQNTDSIRIFMYKNFYINIFVTYEYKRPVAETSIIKQEAIKDLLRLEYTGKKSETSKFSMKS